MIHPLLTSLTVGQSGGWEGSGHPDVLSEQPAHTQCGHVPQARTPFGQHDAQFLSHAATSPQFQVRGALECSVRVVHVTR